VNRWTAYCDELGIASLGLGAIILRRRTAASGATNWVRSDVLTESPNDWCGRQIERVFAAQDFLSAVADDRALLERAFRAADDHRLHQTLAPKDGTYVTERAQIELTGGFRFRGNLDAHTIRLLQRCDGSRTLSAIARELAQDGRLTPEQAEAAAADTVRGLLAWGFLVPAGTDAGDAANQR
jgi:hypothetical protein